MGEKVPRSGKVTYLIYAMLYPHPLDVQIYSRNLFLNYYILITIQVQVQVLY
jgi:hypothetical protein